MKPMTVIIPTRGRRSDLPDLLDTLLRQDGDRIEEIVVVVDGSPDERPAIDGVRWLWTGASSGPARARNLGAAAARTETLIFVDDDVCPAAGALAALHAALGAAGTMAAAGIIRPAEDVPVNPYLRFAYGGAAHGRGDRDRRREPWWHFCTSLAAVRRDAFERAGGFNEVFREAAYEDVELAFRLRQAGGGLVFCPQAVGLHRRCMDRDWFVKRCERHGALLRMLLDLQPALAARRHRFLGRLRGCRGILGCLWRLGRGCLPAIERLPAFVALPLLKCIHACGFARSFLGGGEEPQMDADERRSDAGRVKGNPCPSVSIRGSSIRQFSSAALKFFLFPALFYLAAFTAITWPLMLRFFDLFFADGGDGLQMVWNIWWVRKAVVELHQHPWYTTLLHYPHGVSLLAHTLHPLKGFGCLPLFAFMDLVPVFNTAVVSSFVLGGVGMFWLAYYRCRAWLPSLVAGYIFTFCSYHFAHATGHLQLVALEWLPVFLLAWLAWLDRPGRWRAVGAALALWLVILCDYYYFFFAVLAAGIMVLWAMWDRRDLLFLFRRERRQSLALFAVLSLVTSGVLAGALSHLSHTDPLSGVHVAREFPLDPLALLIPGGHWRFSHLTRWYWTRLPGVEHEMSVHIGLSVTLLLAAAIVLRKRLAPLKLSLWWIVACAFGMLALGQRLNMFGHEFGMIPLPYVLMERLVPPFRISGVPVRMVVLVILSSAVIAAAALKQLFDGSRPAKAFAGCVLALLVVEYLPSPIPAHRIATPEYVRVLKDHPGTGGVYDTVTPHTQALYFQTTHGKPVAFGYVSREPLSTRRKDVRMRRLFDAGRYRALRETYGIRYFILPPPQDIRSDIPAATILYQDRRLRLFDAGEREGPVTGFGSASEMRDFRPGEVAF